VPERIWVGLLEISDKTAHKLALLHGLQAHEVRDAIQCVSGLSFSWEHDPDRGWRAIVRGVPIRGILHLVVLYPLEGDPFGEGWNLGSAYPDV
jgi:hypothetical protein